MNNQINKDISNIYTESFYQFTINSELKSSSDVAQILTNHFNPSSVIDIGCGCGIYLKAFHDLGIKDLVGYDGSENAIKKSLLPEKIKLHDLRHRIQLNRKYDLCLCMEVAEHIENRYSESLVDTLTNLSDTVFFTAAPPGQGGEHHINEQPFSFWINLFEKKGFNYIHALTQKISEEMKSKNVIWWVARNLMIFRRSYKSDLADVTFAKPVRIAYLIMAHNNPAQIRRLLGAIYHPDNYYILHIDKESDISCHKIAEELQLSYSNVSLLGSQTVIWAGFSVLEVELRAIRKLLEMKSNWDFFINLSGQDFPIKTQKEITSYLAIRKSCNFIEIFDPYKHWHSENPSIRIEGFFIEIPKEKKLLRLADYLNRSWPFENAKWYGGSQWVILNRLFCEYIISNKKVFEFEKFFSNTVAPDESFFQTVLMASDFSSSVVNDNKREIYWEGNRPKIYKMEDLQILLNSSNFFARKFDSDVDDKILDELGKNILGNTGFL
jgi:hypothetical protein